MKKSRKRLLISSVAMLLVAMLALGTATFAWFSQNTKATASGITAKTTQASKILLSETGGDDYTNKLIFTTFANGEYSPATPGANIASPSWKKTLAASIDAGVKDPTESYEDAVRNTDYTETNLYVKYDNDTEGATQAVKIVLNVNDNSSGASSTEDFLRVALVPVDNTTKALVENPVVWGSASDDFAKTPDSMSLTTAATSANTITTTNNKTMISSITLAGNTAYHFKVFVWFEGTDPQCIDSNANNDFTVNFEVSNAA